MALPGLWVESRGSSRLLVTLLGPGDHGRGESRVELPLEMLLALKGWEFVCKYLTWPS